MTISSTNNDTSSNGSSSYYNDSSGSNSISEESSSSDDHGLRCHKRLKGISGLACQCSFKGNVKYSRDRSTPIPIPKHAYQWGRKNICKHQRKESDYHDLRKVSNKKERKNGLVKVCCWEHCRKKKWSHVHRKLSRHSRKSAASCGWCDYDSCKSWLLDDRVDESTTAYYNKRRKPSSSSKKNMGRCCSHHPSDHADEETRTSSKIMHRSGCHKSGLVKHMCSTNTTTGNKNMGVMGDSSLIQDFEKEEDKDQDTINLSKKSKSAVESNKLVDVKHDLPRDSLHGGMRVAKEHYLNVGATKSETLDVSCNFTSPSHQQSILHHNLNQKMSQASETWMGHGLGRPEGITKQKGVIILDHSEDECIKKDELNIDVCLRGQGTEVKKKENMKINHEKNIVACRRDQEIVDKEQKIMRIASLEENVATCTNNYIENDILLTDEAILPKIKVGTIHAGCSQSNKSTQSLTQNSTTVMGDLVMENEPHFEGVTFHSTTMGSQRRKKRMIDKNTLPFVVLNEKCKDPVIVAEKAILSKMVVSKPHMWEIGMLCDLCHRGPSLLMGEWYSWCCGSRLHYCTCSSALKLKLKSGMSSKKSNKIKKNAAISLSGVVHKMCGLWSSEVYEEGEVLQGLCNAVKRGKTLTCSACREFGATLGCRVKACRRSFHYPCADELASKLCCRMWDGVQFPITCRGHRHVSHSCANAKEKAPDLKKWRFRGLVPRRNIGIMPELINQSSSCDIASEVIECHTHHSQSAQGKKESMKAGSIVIEISSESEDLCKKEISDSNMPSRSNNSKISMKVGQRDSKQDILHQERIETVSHCVPRGALYHMGTNVLCDDISGGREAVLIPCTNDIDSDPAPIIQYITKNRYSGKAKYILESVLLNENNLANACEGCDIDSIDDPHKEPSAHAGVKGSQRVTDSRFDWQGQPMFRRLPYDRFGRLLLGTVTKDIIECNSRCPCGVNCLNRELQKGIQTPLEVFKTKDRGWGVRTMEQIPRGKFVMEYVGEILTHCEAEERGWTYDRSSLSFLFNVDHPDVPTEDLLVIDGFHMSNVARFINHSCDGNLSVYRVYTDTTDLRFCRIGHYASRDIEIGEELCYDYGYTTYETRSEDFSTDPTAIKCLCGARNCKGWLWTGSKCG